MGGCRYGRRKKERESVCINKFVGGKREGKNR
jgi:hypothetical protein